MTGVQTCALPISIEGRLIGQARAGDVILLHDGGHAAYGIDRGNTVRATDTFIRRMKDQGFQFVTVGEMMKVSAL